MSIKLDCWEQYLLTCKAVVWTFLVDLMGETVCLRGPFAGDVFFKGLDPTENHSAIYCFTSTNRLTFSFLLLICLYFIIRCIVVSDSVLAFQTVPWEFLWRFSIIRGSVLLHVSWWLRIWQRSWSCQWLSCTAITTRFWSMYQLTFSFILWVLYGGFWALSPHIFVCW